MKHVWPTAWRALVVVLAGAGIGLAWHPSAARIAPAVEEPEQPAFVRPTIPVAEARAAWEAGELVVVDARQRIQYEAGHIPGALAEWQGPGRSLLRELRRWIPLDARVVVVGQGNNDFSATRAASRLRFVGIAGARTLEGGMDAWEAAGLPTVQGWDMQGVATDGSEGDG